MDFRIVDSCQQHISNQLDMVRLQSIKGTPEYMAPEVLAVLNAKVNETGKPAFYDFRCDVWSLGVVVHTMLVGHEPYTLEEVAMYVEVGVPLKDTDVHDPQAAAFLRRCLCPDFYARPTSSELLYSDPWINRFLNATSDNSYDNYHIVQERLHEFTNLSHFKRAALTAAARRLNPNEHEELRRLFQSIDTDCTGTITLKELFAFLQPHQDQSTEMDWAIRAFAAMDTDLSGEVDYTEFLAAVMDSHIENRKDLAWAAFSAFDVDGSGTISRDELARVLEDVELQRLLEVKQVAEHYASEASNNSEDFRLTASARKLADLSFETHNVAQLMQVGDVDGDGAITFEEFLSLLKWDGCGIED